MLGGLYGDLPPPSSTPDDDNPNHQSSTTTTTAVWSSSVKMAPPTLRKPPYTTPPPSILRSKPNPKPQTPLPPPPPLPDNHHQSPPSYADVSQPALVGVTSSVVEEYDPAKPNSYEEYRKEKKRLAQEAEVRRELERRQLEEEERERERGKTVISVNNSISGEEAWRRRGGDDGGFSIGKSETEGLGVGAGGQMTAAQRMMAKMGWKEGQGLGRQEQGITTPLMAKKTDRRAGVIVNASNEKKQQQQQVEEQEKKAVKSVSFNGPPTRVLLLRNMVWYSCLLFAIFRNFDCVIAVLFDWCFSYCGI
ncbi:hypothetical protein RND81_07G164400 [Saponaria officinalis]|uniref:G-patch domain-containing protein n=1 Tax=Saponaria officinalis TaxID=3572 RepID=A0AAW1JP39_SAPOF